MQLYFTAMGFKEEFTIQAEQAEGKRPVFGWPLLVSVLLVSKRRESSQYPKSTPAMPYSWKLT